MQLNIKRSTLYPLTLPRFSIPFIASIECLLVEIRHLQPTEVLEVEEYFAPGQKGSSAITRKCDLGI